MAEHRDSPDSDPDAAGGPRTSKGRRFARMVHSPAGRRLALPRLLAAAVALMLAVVMAGLGGSKALKALAGWVAGRPEHQIRFVDIELSPSPDPWVVGGRSRILQGVRAGANYEETIGLLDLDAEALARAFRLSPWIKQVDRVVRTPGHVAIQLVYRKPVAVVVRVEPSGAIAYPVDEEAVRLPEGEIDWSSPSVPFRVKGIARPLIEIAGVQSTGIPRPGMPWKRDDGGEPDPVIGKAAALAGFIQSRKTRTVGGREVPEFVSIYLPSDPDKPFFLVDGGKNLVSWGKGPGDEKPGEPSTEDRWAMLLDWIDRTGPLNARAPKFLDFTRNGARISEGRPAGKK